MLSIGNAEKVSSYQFVEPVNFIMPDELQRLPFPHHIVVIDNIFPLAVIERMREEFELNIGKAVWENATDEHGAKQSRWKLFEPEYAKDVAIQMLCSGTLQKLCRPINDYAFRMYAGGLTKTFEWAYGRYSDGGAYRWHTDHWPLRETIRLLNFSVFLTDDCGGAIEINQSIGSEDWEETGKVDSAAAELTIEPKIGRLLLMPSYFLHRVTPATGVREVLFGHVCMEHGYDYDTTYGS